MLADHAARVLACRSRFGAEAGRIGGHADRKLLFVEHLLAHQIGERGFGGRDQPVAAGGAEQILTEIYAPYMLRDDAMFGA